jgi:hypothetical protein
MTSTNNNNWLKIGQSFKTTTDDDDDNSSSNIIYKNIKKDIIIIKPIVTSSTTRTTSSTTENEKSLLKEEEDDKSADVKALLSQEVNSLSAYGQSSDGESRDSVLKKIKLFIEENHVAQQNNLIQLEDYEGLKNFKDLISDLKAAVEVISMGGKHLQQCSGEDMTVSVLAQ